MPAIAKLKAESFEKVKDSVSRAKGNMDRVLNHASHGNVDEAIMAVMDAEMVVSALSRELARWQTYRKIQKEVPDGDHSA